MSEVGPMKVTLSLHLPLWKKLKKYFFNRSPQTEQYQLIFVLKQSYLLYF